MDDDTTVLSAGSPKQIWSSAWRANLGYNMDWLSTPTSPCTTGDLAVATMAKINKPAQMVLFIDSVWGTTSSFSPLLGGNWAVDAPSIPPDLKCWLGGWRCYSAGTCNVWNAYGGAYPFHNARTNFNVTFTDGHCKNLKLGQLIAGVNPATRFVYDNDAFIWGYN